MHIVFPEYQRLFSANFGLVFLSILETCPSANKIAKTDIRTLRKLMKPHGLSGRGVPFSAETLKELAKSSIGQVDEIIEMEIKHLVGMIKTINSNLSEVDKKIEEYSAKLNSPILEISGISHFSGMSIITELGDINRFNNSGQIIRFAGVNPTTYQSGEYHARMTRISKKGSNYFRKTLYQIIQPVIENNPVFKTYYIKKRNEGKTHRSVQGHCIRKLLRVIFHSLKTGNSFNAKKLIVR